MLGFFVGSDSIATTLIVGAFLFGLGVGSLIGGWFADRFERRAALLGFAACEIGIGLLAILSPWIFYDALFGSLMSYAESRLTAAVLTLLALLPATTLMGMSLPLLARAMVVRLEHAAERIGVLYGLNTLGGGIGCLVAGFVLIAQFGYHGAVWLAACINFLVATIALLAGRRDRATAATRIEGRAATAAGRPLPWVWALFVFVSGFLIISLEIVWFRVLGALMNSNAYAFAWILGIFLAGDGTGIIAGARLVARTDDPQKLLYWLQGAVASYALASVMLVYVLPPWLPAQFTGRHYAAILPAIVFPPAFALGMSFPIVQKAVQRDLGLIGWRVGIVQISNILGNTAGAVFTGLILLAWLGTAGVLFLIGLIGLAFLLLLLRLQKMSPIRPALLLRPAAVVGLSTVLVLLLLSLPENAKLWARLNGSPDMASSFVAENHAGVAVLRPLDAAARCYELHVNGAWQAEINPFLPIQGAVGFLGPLVHPNPRTVLLIGFGSGGTLRAVGISSTTERIRVVELAAPVIEVMREYANRFNFNPLKEVLSDPRIELAIADGRHVLFTTDERFDVIVTETVSPRTAGSNLLFSREFFSAVRERLTPNGISVQWAATPRTVATFVSVFPYVVRVNNVLLGSAQPIPFELERLRAQLLTESARIADSWNVNDLITWLEQGPVQSWGPNDARSQEDLNTDFFPRDEQYLANR
jgi:spermidine synthase